MRNRLVNTFALIAGLATASSVASAQVTTARLYEFGIDGGVAFGLNKPRVTTIGIPAQALRVGIFMNDKWSLEPTAYLQSTSGSGNRSTQYSLRVGALYHMSKTPARVGAGWYARPFLGLLGTDGSGGSSDTRALIGAGYGYKYPLSDRLAARAETNYTYLFAAGGSDGVNQLGLNFGLSFFTR